MANSVRQMGMIDQKATYRRNPAMLAPSRIPSRAKKHRVKEHWRRNLRKTRAAFCVSED
jgi:hypothetical protein